MSAKSVVIFAILTVSFLLLLPLTITLALAQTSTLKIESESSADDDTDEADQILTNGRMRAESGSLSRLSVRTSLFYFGGTVEKPLDAERPNINGGNDTQDVLQNLSGVVGLKYRVSKRSSLHFDGGLRVLTPFNRTVRTTDADLNQQFRNYGGKLVMNDPSVGYSYLFRAFGTQNFLELEQEYTTDPVLRSIGAVTNTSIHHSFAYDLGTSRFTFAVESAITYQWFDKNAEDLGSNQTQYQIEFYPGLEYALSDRVVLRTVLGYIFEHTRDFRDSFLFKRDLVYQSLGVGFSLTRDVYIYPNIQFLPDDIRGDKTNVALQTFINVF